MDYENNYDSKFIKMEMKPSPLDIKPDIKPKLEKKPDIKPKFEKKPDIKPKLEKKPLFDYDDDQQRRPVSLLHELCAKRAMTLEWNLTRCSTNSCGSIPLFTYEVSVPQLYLKASGTANKKKTAKHIAATNMLLLISKETDEKELAKKIAKPSIVSETFLENYVGSLQRLCGLNRWKTPHYTEPRQSGQPHRKVFTCTCVVYIKYEDGNVDEIKADGVGVSMKLSKQEAAKKMRQTLVELLPDCEDPERDVTKPEVKDENMFKREPIKPEIPFTGSFVDGYEDTEDEDEQEELEQRETIINTPTIRVKPEPGLEINPSELPQGHYGEPSENCSQQLRFLETFEAYERRQTEERQRQSELINQNFIDETEQVNQDNYNCQVNSEEVTDSTEVVNSLSEIIKTEHEVKIENIKQEIVNVKQEEIENIVNIKQEKVSEEIIDIVQDEEMKNINCKMENVSIDNLGKNGQDFLAPQANRGKIISEFHDSLFYTCGYDARVPVLEGIRKLVGRMVMSKQTQEPNFIDYYLDELDTVMAFIGCEVTKTCFQAHDKSFIMLIHVNTIPEIVEVEHAKEKVGLGVDAFFKVIEKIKELLK